MGLAVSWGARTGRDKGEDEGTGVRPLTGEKRTEFQKKEVIKG